MKIKPLFKRFHKRIYSILHSFRFVMIGSVFLIMLTSAVLAGATAAAIYLANPGGVTKLTPVILILIALPASLFLGTVFSVIVSKQILRPLDDMIAGTERVSRGDFSGEVPIRYKKNQFARLITSFNEMTKELSEIEMFRQDFINNFSHEFKTPLTAIRGYVQELKNDDLTDEEREETIQTVIEACDRLTGMSSAVLLLSKLENQSELTDVTEFDLSEQLRNVILVQEKNWTKKEIEFDLDFDDPVLLESNSDLISHIWQNLLSNAIKFCPPAGGVISISCKKKKGGASVTFRDNGIGMNQETLLHIFDKFYQADTSRKSEGNGLGLALVKRIVTLSGGEISVESEPEKGSEFTVWLPRKIISSDK